MSIANGCVTVSNDSLLTGVLILVDLRVRFGDCSSSPLARFCGPSFCAPHCELHVFSLFRAPHCELPASAFATLRAFSAVCAPRCGQPVVRDIPSGSVATSVLEKLK